MNTKQQNKKYTIEHRDGRKWYALRLEDFPDIKCDSEARAVCELFAKETGNEYRAKVGKIIIYETANHQFKSNPRFEKMLKYVEAMGAINRASQDDDEIPFNETKNAENYRKS